MWVLCSRLSQMVCFYSNIIVCELNEWFWMYIVIADFQHISSLRIQLRIWVSSYLLCSSVYFFVLFSSFLYFYLLCWFTFISFCHVIEIFIIFASKINKLLRLVNEKSFWVSFLINWTNINSPIYLVAHTFCQTLHTHALGE